MIIFEYCKAFAEDLLGIWCSHIPLLRQIVYRVVTLHITFIRNETAKISEESKYTDTKCCQHKMCKDVQFFANASSWLNAIFEFSIVVHYNEVIKR